MPSSSLPLLVPLRLWILRSLYGDLRRIDGNCLAAPPLHQEHLSLWLPEFVELHRTLNRLELPLMQLFDQCRVAKRVIGSDCLCHHLPHGVCLCRILGDAADRSTVG